MVIMATLWMETVLPVNVMTTSTRWLLEIVIERQEFVRAVSEELAVTTVKSVKKTTGKCLIYMNT
jgi:kynureninase